MPDSEQSSSNHRQKTDRRLNVGVIFGGVSPEHEVAVISALQAAAALDRDRYRPVPIYVAKDGSWYTGEKLLDVEEYKDLDQMRKQATSVMVDPSSAHGKLEVVERTGGGLFGGRPRRYRIDVALIGMHGGSGEDGGLQGLCEMLNVPYTGSGILGSAVGMDKVISKMLCRDQDIPIVDFTWLRESDWAYEEEACLDRCEEELGYPLIVKPARGGSSIGISRAENRAELDASIEEAFRYDDKVVIEQAVKELREINCAILGDANEAQASVLEEPVPTDEDEVLTFQDKYMRENGGGKEAQLEGGSKQGGGPGGMASQDRIIPAELSEERTREIQELGVRIFQLFECAGAARIDFMIDEATGDVFFNEINTIPGSFSFYLWKPTGIPFDELTHRMVELALKRHQARNGRIRSYDVNLLAEKSLQGIKGSKTE